MNKISLKLARFTPTLLSPYFEASSLALTGTNLMAVWAWEAAGETLDAANEAVVEARLANHMKLLNENVALQLTGGILFISGLAEVLTVRSPIGGLSLVVGASVIIWVRYRINRAARS